MKCLHGEEAASSTTENGNFWFCAQNPKCQFICSEDDGYLYERAIEAFLTANQVLPKCCVLKDSDDPQQCNHAKFYVVKDPNKESYGRPFFKCSKKDDRCEYFEWGDETIIQKPLCKHGKRCKVWKVKKEGPNQGRSFAACPQPRIFASCPHPSEERCNFFDWFNPAPIPNPMGKKPEGKNTSNKNDETYKSVYTPNYYMEYTPIPKRKKMKHC